MLKLKIDPIVKSVLTEIPETRDSNKRLLWKVLDRLGFVHSYHLDFREFLKCPKFETILKAKKRIQKNNPELKSSEEVKATIKS